MTQDDRAAKARRYEELRDQGKSHDEAVAIIEGKLRPATSVAQPVVAQEPTGQAKPSRADLVRSVTGMNVDPSFLTKQLPFAMTGGPAFNFAGGAIARLLKTIGATGATGAVTGGLSGATVSEEPTFAGRITSPEARSGAAYGGTIGAGLPTAVGTYRLGKEIVSGLLKRSTIESETAGQIGDVLGRLVRQGVSSEVGRAAGVPVVEPRVVRRGLEQALDIADDARFNPIWQQFRKGITDPAFLEQWDAIAKEVPAGIQAVKKEQHLLLKPLNEALRKIKVPGTTEFVTEGRFTIPILGTAKTRRVPTLQTAHRVKTNLDKAVLAADRAEAAGNLTSDQSMAVGAIRRAAGQLKALAFENVEGGAQYQQALAASAAERRVLDALEEGTEVLRPTANPLGPRMNTPAAIAEGIERYQTAAPTAVSPLAAARSGVAGALSLAEDPLAVLNQKRIRDNLSALLGEPAIKELDIAVAPWKRAARLIPALEEPIGAQGLAGALGGAKAATGGSPRTLIGSLGTDVLARRLAVAQAKELAPFFIGKKLTGPDLKEFMEILSAIQKGQAARAQPLGPLAGILGVTAGRVAGQP